MSQATLHSYKNYQQAIAKDKPIHSVVKVISWRVIRTLDTLVVSYFITHEFKTASSIAGIELITKMSLYFFHERFWNTVKWGK